MNQKLNDLVKKLHQAQENNNSKKIISSLEKLANYHYKNKDLVKTERILKEIKDYDDKSYNLYYNLSLIELEKNNLNLAQKYLSKEIKNNPTNNQAKKVLEKIKISTNIPVSTFILSLCMILIYIFFHPISLTDLSLYALSQMSFTINNIFTSIFIHGNFLHLTLNLIILVSFGLALEKHIGSLKFLIIFLSSAIIGNYIQLIFMPTNTFVLGASGGIFGIIGAQLMREPTLKMRVLGIIKVPLIILLALYFVIIKIIFDYNIISFNQSGEIAHIVGFIIGMILIAIFYSTTIKTFYNWILILFGFYIVSFFTQETILYYTDFSAMILYYIFMIVVGLVLVLYSYLQISEIRRLDIENE